MSRKPVSPSALCVTAVQASLCCAVTTINLLIFSKHPRHILQNLNKLSHPCIRHVGASTSIYNNKKRAGLALHTVLTQSSSQDFSLEIYFSLCAVNGFTSLKQLLSFILQYCYKVLCWILSWTDILSGKSDSFHVISVILSILSSWFSLFKMQS